MRSYHFPRLKKAQLLLNNIKTDDAFNMTLFKKRRSGKTSFLLNDIIPLTKEKHNEEIIAVYISFLGVSDENIIQLFSSQFLSQLTEQMSFKQKTFDKLSLIKSFSFSLGLKFVDEKIGLQSKANIENEDLELDFLSLFNKFHELFPKHKLLLCLDEFQELIHLNKKKKIIGLLRTAIDINQKFVKAIFTGSSYYKLMSFFNDYNQPFYNFGGSLTLEDFEENFVDHVLSVFFENTGIYLDKEIALKIFYDTDKIPYYLTTALLNLQNNPNSNLKYEVDKLIIADKDLFDKDLIYVNFFNKLSKYEKIILIRLLKNISPLSNDNKDYVKWLIRLKENVELTNQEVKNKIAYALKKLLKTEMLIKENSNYKIVDLKLIEWLVNQPELLNFNFLDN